MDWAWLWQKLQGHSSAQDTSTAWPTKVFDAGPISCSIWVQYHFPDAWNWEEDSLSSLGSYPDITETLEALLENPEVLTIDSVYMQQLKRFPILMYIKGCGASSVNEARTKLFSHGLRSLEPIPPTQAALCQHVKHSLLQASYIWKQVFVLPPTSSKS